jgi:thiamine kinase-like enzyme
LAEHSVRGTDEIVYFNVDEGVKITRYIEGARYPDAFDPLDIGRCVALLKNIHESGIVVAGAFDLMEHFLEYETRVSVKASPGEHMSGYGALRAEAVAAYNGLKDIFTPCFNHIDPIKYNFLFTRKQDYLIDFEYSCMASPMIDIAEFAIYHKLSIKRIDGLMSAYLGHIPSSNEKKSLYRYLALDGLYLALWYLERLDEGAKMRRNMNQCYRCALRYVKETRNVY